MGGSSPFLCDFTAEYLGKRMTGYCSIFSGFFEIRGNFLFGRAYYKYHALFEESVFQFTL